MHAPVMSELGWHLQLWIDVKDLPDTLPILRGLGLAVVIDHMGRTDARAGTDTAGFRCLLRWLGEGECWVKLSGAHADPRPSGDWPHPRTEGEMPDVGHLYELLCDWTPSTATLQRILVSNPATLY